MEHSLQGNIPLRHLINVKPPFISWQRSAFKEVNNWGLGPCLKRILFSVLSGSILNVFLDMIFFSLSLLHKFEFRIVCQIQKWAFAFFLQRKDETLRSSKMTYSTVIWVYTVTQHYIPFSKTGLKWWGGSLAFKTDTVLFILL